MEKDIIMKEKKNLKLNQEMEKEENMIFMVIYYLKVNIKMEKEMEKE